MIYPQNFEQKTGFDKVRRLISDKCLSPLGQERVAEMEFSADYTTVIERLEQTDEFVRILHGEVEFPASFFFDVETDTPGRNLAGRKGVVRPETFATDNQRYCPFLPDGRG